MHSGTLGSSCLSACLSQLCGAWAGGEAGRGKEVTAMSRREMAKPEDPGAGGLTFWPPGLRCRVRGSRGSGESKTQLFFDSTTHLRAPALYRGYENTVPAPKTQPILSVLPPTGLLRTASQRHTLGRPPPPIHNNWLFFHQRSGCGQPQGFCSSCLEALSGVRRGMGSSGQQFRWALHREPRSPIVLRLRWAVSRVCFQNIQEPGTWSQSVVQ